MNNDKDFDVLVIDSLWISDLIVAEHLSRKGLKCGVLRQNRHKEPEKESIGPLSTYHTHFSESDIVWTETVPAFLRIARRSRLIVSFTGALIWHLRMFWPLRQLLGLPPVVNWFSGSDILELAIEASLPGRLYRQYLRFVDLNIGFVFPHALKNLMLLKVPNLVFLRFPYLLPDPSVQFRSHDANGIVRFFHASHLDWKVNDPGQHRYSSKGNDRFIKAFARAIRNGLRAHCVILDRGPDREVAKALIQKLDVVDYFEWKPQLSRDDLVNEYLKADVVVDQFDVGGLGGIAVEAMALGKPAMVWTHENGYRIAYPELPPVFNAHTEEDIYCQIMRCKDRVFLQDLGQRAKEWVYKYLHWETCLDQFLFYYSLLTGHRVIDYGWDLDPYVARRNTLP